MKMRRALLWVLAAGILARAVCILIRPMPQGLKRMEPSIAADNLNAGRGFIFEQYGATYHAWKEPLHIVLLAQLVKRMNGSQLAILLMQSFFGLCAAYCLTLLARLLLEDVRKAAIAGILAATNPFLIYYDTHFIHPLSMDVWLFVLTTWAIVRAQDRPSDLRRTAWAGALTGLALWERSTILMSGLGAWLIGAVIVPARRRGIVLRNAAVWLCISAALISPWLIRNRLLLGRTVMTTDVAHILWLGNNPWSNGTYSDGSGARIINSADTAFQERIWSSSELEQHDAFLEASRRFIRDEPMRFAQLILRRLWAFVWFSPNAGIEYSAAQRVLYRAGYAALLMLGLFGLAFHWRRADRKIRRRTAIVLASVAGIAAVHALTAINMKHRVPFELILAIFAAEALTDLIGRVREKRRRSTSRARVPDRPSPLADLVGSP